MGCPKYVEISAGKQQSDSNPFHVHAVLEAFLEGLPNRN